MKCLLSEKASRCVRLESLPCFTLRTLKLNRSLKSRVHLVSRASAQRPAFELLMQMQRCVSLQKVVINVFIELLVFFFFIYDGEKLLSELPCFQT